MKKYNHKEVEKKWLQKWHKDKIYQPDISSSKRPYYNLMMFPYLSAEGLHVGNMYAFTGSDIWGRFQRMHGYDVFQPIGLDGFGIHSENYAIKIGEHIKDVSERTEKHFYKQLRMIGNQFDWSRRVETYKPGYYKWTQWLFLQMYKHGLAYRKKAKINWCPSCKTVLSDEQVEGGICERCKSEAEKRDMEQWFWRITDYAERLLENLEWLNWSSEVKVGQKNWIGKSEGINIVYRVKGLNTKITCFTSYPETMFGATFIVLSPEYPDILKITKKECLDKVKKYITTVQKKSDIERVADGREKSGVFTGRYCMNQFTGFQMPIWVGDFVLAHVGTGAVVGVPGHDIRDYEFAKKFGFQIIRVMKSYEGDKSKIDDAEKVNHEGIMMNSTFVNGLDHKQAREKIMDYIEEKKWGQRQVQYKLRDWCISRQRYWGDPIPMINCKKCGWQPIGEKDLPVLLPEIERYQDILPDGSGKGPLAKQQDFVETKCPKCGGQAVRETDVMDPFVDSSWYFLRYLSTDLDDVAFDKQRTKKWLPVDMYIGGKEHTVLHLLYARFVTMALKDLGHIDFEEPFTRFFGHGLLIKEGSKMSKSKGNVVNPDEYIGLYGADAVRMYLMFLGNFEHGGDWRDTGMKGMSRFVNKVWRLFDDIEREGEGAGVGDLSMIDKVIHNVGKDIKRLSFNTAIAKIMEFINWYKAEEGRFTNIQRRRILETLCLLLAPFAPFITEELWSKLGNKYSIHQQNWPEYSKELVRGKQVMIVVQINGKVRDTIKVQRDLAREEVIRWANESSRVKKYLKGKVKKVVFIKNRIVNFVI